MWIVKLALSRPYTFVVLALVLILISPIVLLRTPVDIFPNINIPVISVIWTYSGLAPAEMGTRIVSIFERSLTTSVNNIEHIESQSLNGVAVVKVFLQPSANIDGAISEVIAEAQVGLKQFPAGITPPLVISYNASSVPILQLGLSGKGLSEQQLNDLGLNFIRPQLATIQGASVPIPYGGKVRQIMVDIDSQKLLSKGLSPTDVVNAVNTQNVVLPSGTAKIGNTEYNVGLNGNPLTIEELNGLPVRVVDGGTVWPTCVTATRYKRTSCAKMVNEASCTFAMWPTCVTATRYKRTSCAKMVNEASCSPFRKPGTLPLYPSCPIFSRHCRRSRPLSRRS